MTTPGMGSSRAPSNQIDAIRIDDFLGRLTEKAQAMIPGHVSVGVRHDYHAAVVKVGMPLGENAPNAIAHPRGHGWSDVDASGDLKHHRR